MRVDLFNALVSSSLFWILDKEMEEIKTEPVDFVREFQEYLTQQTHHVNMISGSVCAEKESVVPYPAGENKIHYTIQPNNNRLSPQMSKFKLFLFSCPKECTEWWGSSVCGGKPVNG